MGKMKYEKMMTKPGSYPNRSWLLSGQVIRDRNGAGSLANAAAEGAVGEDHVSLG